MTQLTVASFLVKTVNFAKHYVKFNLKTCASDGSLHTVTSGLRWPSSYLFSVTIAMKASHAINIHNLHHIIAHGSTQFLVGILK